MSRSRGEPVAGLPQRPDGGQRARLAHAVHARSAAPRLGPRRGRRRRAHRLELLPRPLELALLVEQPGEDVAQRDEHLDVQRGVDEPVFGEGTARPVGRPVPLLQRRARAAAPPSGRGLPAAARAAARPARCRTAARARARPPRDRAGPGSRRAAPIPAREAPEPAPTGRSAAVSDRPAPYRHPHAATAPGRPVGSSGSPMPVPRRRRWVPNPRRRRRRCAPALQGPRRPGGARRRGGQWCRCRSSVPVPVAGSAQLSDACVSVSG